MAVVKCWLLPESRCRFGTPPLRTNVIRLQVYWGRRASSTVPSPLGTSWSFLASAVHVKWQPCCPMSAFPHLCQEKPKKAEASHATAIAQRFPVGPCTLATCLQKCGPKLTLRGHSEIRVKHVRDGV